MSHFALKEIESPRNNRFDRPVIACIGENYSLGRTVPTELVPMADIQSQGCCFDLLRRGDDGRASLSHDVLGRLCEVPQEPKVWILASKFASELAVIFRTSSGFSADVIVDICRQCVDRVYGVQRFSNIAEVGSQICHIWSRDLIKKLSCSHLQSSRLAIYGTTWWTRSSDLDVEPMPSGIVLSMPTASSWRMSMASQMVRSLSRTAG
jgi:hypothetical protein